MNRFLLFAVMLSAIAVYSLGMGHPDMDNNPSVIKIKAKICDKNSKPTEEQWTAYLACSKPCNETKHDDPNHADRKEKMKAAFDDCVNKADDINDLKTNNVDKDRSIAMLCSTKTKECLKAMHDQHHNDKEAKKVDGADPPKPDGGDHQKNWESKIACGLTALGLTA